MSGQNQSRIRRIYEKSKDYIDYKMGTAGALVMAGIVWKVNYSEGLTGATTAALKQGGYTLLSGGLICKACEKIARSKRIKNNLLAIALAGSIPALVSISAVYGVHRLKGTPKPLESTIPTMIAAPLGLMGIAAVKRRKFLQEQER